MAEQAHKEQPTAVAATARTVLRERVRGAAISARSVEAPRVSLAPRRDDFLPAEGCAEAGDVCGAVPGVPEAGARPAAVQCCGLPVDVAGTAYGDEGEGEDGVPEMFG
jgi:hypothetical protein